MRVGGRSRHRHPATPRPASSTTRGRAARSWECGWGLAGDHQVDNAALALAAVGLLGVPLDEAARRAGLDEARWPGRLERVAPDLRVDGAHNPEGAAALARALAGEPRVTLLVGLLADKDAASVLGALLPVCAHLVCTEPDSPRAPAGGGAGAGGAPPGTGAPCRDRALRGGGAGGGAARGPRPRRAGGGVRIALPGGCAAAPGDGRSGRSGAGGRPALRRGT